MLTFQSRMQARGNLRTFQKIQRQGRRTNPEEMQMDDNNFQSGSRLLRDAFDVVNNTQEENAYYPQQEGDAY